jgi:WD40 repeat protein/WD40 domain-containing protein
MGAVTVGRIVVLAILMGSAACAGETLGPASGALQVAASVVGDGSDLDGFLVVVGRTIERPLVPGQPVLLNAIAPGEYDVALEGVGPNCTLLGPAVHATTVVAGDTAHVAFEVACDPAGGMLRVTVQTSGSDLDPNGYDVLVDGARVASVEPESAVLSAAPAGDRTVTLGSVNPNCIVEPTSRSLAISIGGLATAEFEIQCVASARAGRGHEIAYTSSDEFGQSAIYVVNDDGTHTERLFPEIQLSHDTPAWAPDGTHIAFFVTPTFDRPIPLDSAALLTIADAEGSERSEFSEPSFGIAWSPDGSRLALGGLGLIDCPPVRLFHVDGSGEESFDVGCFSHAVLRSFAWSPDGRQIAFVADVPTEDAFMSILRLADLTIPGQSAPPPGCDYQTVQSVSWSPDGSRLAVAADGIFVLDLASATCTRLRDDLSDGSPSWSPDGTRIAFSSRRDGTSDIYVMEADGSNQTRITRSTSGAGGPSWRP